MFATKKMWSVLTIVLALGLGTGCDLATTPAGDNDGNGTSPGNGTSSKDDTGVYSYNVDEVLPGLFGTMSPAMTMNDWCLNVTGNQPRTYDQLVKDGFVLYKDKNLKTPFTGSDILNENIVVYSESSINGQGKKTGDITGTITLTDIPNPAAAKIFIHGSSYGGRNNWWDANGRINISSATGTSPTLNWSLPMYETSLTPNSQTTFELIVLPGDSLKSYTVSVPTKKTISDANANVGDLGTVSVKGVTLSGTINVTHNGQPVPYVEIYANYPVQGPLGITCLYSPEPNAPWSVTFGPNPNNDVDIEFHIFGYSGKNGTPLLDKYATTNSAVHVINNQSVSGIELNVAEN